MQVVLVASEIAPFSKTGGLADVVGALPKALAEIGVKVAVFSPFYPSVRKIKDTKNRPKLKIKTISIKVGERIIDAQVYHKRESLIDFYFIANQEYFDRQYLYGSERGDYSDNAQRFIFFSKAVLESLKQLEINPDIIHCHDWQSGLIPLYLKTNFGQNQSFNQTKTVFTIHNLGYQGLFNPEAFYDIGVPEKYFSLQGLEFYSKVNFLKAGLMFADKLTTVSPTYAKEIQTKQFGFSLEGVLSTRQKDLSGILNGIDYSIWDPAKDELIDSSFDVNNLTNKSKIKKNLCSELGLNLTNGSPLIGFVGRLAFQKGIELIIEATKSVTKDAGFVILGTGEEKYHQLLIELKSQFPKNLSVNLAFNNPLAHRIYAGSDIFLMPSQYEPCGLGQMIAFKYGTIPIGFKTGGLVDTIIDYSLDSEKGNGFLFDNYNVNSLVAKLNEALQLYQQNDKWQNLVKRVMGLDFSWQTSAQKYLKLYSELVKA